MPSPVVHSLQLRRIRPAVPAIRSYVTRAPQAAAERFVVSLESRRQHTAAHAWTVVDRLSGAASNFWTMREALEWVWWIISPPVSADAPDRFAVLPTPEMEVVLVDRFTGYFWLRSPNRLREDIALLQTLAPHLPVAYRRTVTANRQRRLLPPLPAVGVGQQRSARRNPIAERMNG